MAERVTEASGEGAEWAGEESARIKVVRVQKCPHETDVLAAEKSVAGDDDAPAGDSAVRPQLPIVSIDFLPTLTEAISIELLKFADDVTDGPRVKESDCTGEDEEEDTSTPESAVERPEEDSDSNSNNGPRTYNCDVFGTQED